MLRESVNSHKYMDGWQKFCETLPNKKKIFTAVSQWKTLWMPQNDTLLLGHVYKNFCNKCIEICKHDPAYFLSTAGLHGRHV